MVHFDSFYFIFFFELIATEKNCNSSSNKIIFLSNAFESLGIKNSNNDNTKLYKGIPITEEIIDFEGFDNENGTDQLIIPNIVHLLYLQTTTIKFYQAVNIYSIYLNQNPDQIYIHCDNCSFHGHYWEQITSIKGLKEKIRLNKLPYHDTIFGVKYGWVNHHR